MTSAHGFSWEDLRLLQVVAASGSFTTAAASLHFTQSGVSRRVAQLERMARGALFVRQPRGVRPTALGDLLLRHADDLLRRFQALTEDLEAARAGTGGRLRVGSFPTANSSLTPHALGRFRQRHPDVAVTLVEDLSPALLDQVAAGALDIAVVSDYPTGALDHRAAGLRVVHLLDDPLLIALPADHPLSRRRRLRLADLADETWISGAPEGADTVLTLAATRAGFTPAITIHVASWTAKLSFVAAGFGVTIVPRLLAGPLPTNAVLRPLGDDLPARRVFAAFDEHPPTAAQKLADELQAVSRTVEGSGAVVAGDGEGGEHGHDAAGPDQG